jgi:hypothetical protein
MAVRDGEDRDRARLSNDPATEPEQQCPSRAADLIEPACAGDVPRVLLDEVDGIEVWGLIEPWTAEQLVDEMDSWPVTRIPGASADA